MTFFLTCWDRESLKDILQYLVNNDDVMWVGLVRRFDLCLNFEDNANFVGVWVCTTTILILARARLRQLSSNEVSLSLKKLRRRKKRGAPPQKSELKIQSLLRSIPFCSRVCLSTQTQTNIITYTKHQNTRYTDDDDDDDDGVNRSSLRSHQIDKLV